MSSARPLPTFADPDLEAQLSEHGYVVIDLLDADEVTELRQLFDSLDHPVREGFFASNETDEVSYKSQMADRVQDVVGPRAHSVLAGHRLIGGFFMIKWPGETSAKAPHLDWSLVDEDQARSVSFWIPLVDTDEHNGAFICVDGSHQVVGSTHRGGPNFPTQEETQELSDRFPPEAHHRIDARAGQAIVYTHQLIHHSGPNLSDGPRPAVNIAAVPDGVPLVHYRLQDDGTVARLTVDDGYFEAWRWSVPPPEPERIDVIERIFTLTDPVPGEAPPDDMAPEGLPVTAGEFLDPELQAAFDRDGFVVVPLLGPDEVERLREAFFGLAPDAGFGSYYTSQSPDEDHRREVFDVIRAAFAEPTARLLRGVRPVVANFFAKEPVPGSSLVVHQDWAFVDERSSRSLNIWCPLEDATAENGTLRVLPGSHRLLHNLRGTRSGAGGLPSPFDGIEERVTEELLVPVEVPAGWAIINDHRLVHASGENRSGALRIAASLTLVPERAQTLHAWGTDDGQVDLIAIDDDLLLRHAIGTRPEGPTVATVPFELVTLDQALGADQSPEDAPSDNRAATDERKERGVMDHIRRIWRRTPSGVRDQARQSRP